MFDYAGPVNSLLLAGDKMKLDILVPKYVVWNGVVRHMVVLEVLLHPGHVGRFLFGEALEQLVVDVCPVYSKKWFRGKLDFLEFSAVMFRCRGHDDELRRSRRILHHGVRLDSALLLAQLRVPAGTLHHVGEEGDSRRVHDIKPFGPKIVPAVR